MEINIKQVRKDYPFESYFLTATGAIKKPLRVGVIGFAKHEDRSKQITNLKNYCLDLYREMYPNKPKDKFEKLEHALKTDKEFILAVKEQIERISYLSSLERDIVNSDGGVIYCSETGNWAEKSN